MVVLVIGLSIYLWVNTDRQKGMGPALVKNRGALHWLPLLSDHLYASVLYARFQYVEVPLAFGYSLHPVHVSCSFQLCLSLKLGLFKENSKPNFKSMRGLSEP